MAEDAKHPEESKEPIPASAPDGVVMMQDEADLDDYASGEDDDHEISSDIEADFTNNLEQVYAEVDLILEQRAVSNKKLRRTINGNHNEALRQVIERIRDRGAKEQKED